MENIPGGGARHKPSPGRRNSPEAAFGWYDDLNVVRQDETIRPAVDEVFTWLWRHLEGRPGYLVITARMIAEAFSKDARTAREIIDEMKSRGMIHLIDRDKRGFLYLYIYDPNDQIKRRPDPPTTQRRFPFAQNDSPMSPTRRVDTIPYRPAGILAQESPGIFAQESPPQNEQTPQNTGNGSETAGILAQESPPPSMESYEREKSTSSLLHRTTRFHETMEAHEEAPPDNDSQTPNDDDRMGVGFVVAEALNNWAESTTSLKKKEKLLREIHQAVRDPELHPSIAGRAADLVVHSKIDYEQLRAILNDIVGTRRSFEEGIGKGFKTSPGAYFLHRLRQLSAWKEPKSKGGPSDDQNQ